MEVSQLESEPKKKI